MLQIRRTQIHILQENLLDRFIDDTVNHLLTHFPDPCASAFTGRDAVRAFVSRGMDKASSWNVNSAEAVMALLELWLQFGENFERSPLRLWTMNILAHPELPGVAKVDVIRDRHLQLTGGCVMVKY